MDATEIINLAVPVFILLLFVEAIASWRRGWGYYSLNDAMINTSLGAGRQLIDIFTKVALFAGYIAIYEWWHLFDMQISAWWHWPLVILAVDFIYYWQHRWSHEINVLWGGHLVHHSSEEFNISVALRQSYIHDLMVYPLFFVLAVVGLPPFAFFIGAAFIAIYQYWIHTRAIPRFPEWIEKNFNTPSAHRVHHGSNKPYIDKNYAGVFMFIDRLFGTYQAETEEVHYGLTKPVKTWNPLWVNIYYFVDLWKTAAKSNHWKARIKLWFARPGWLPSDVTKPEPEPSPRTGHKFQTDISKPMWRYTITQYLLSGTVSLPLMALYAQMQPLHIVCALAFAFWGGWNVGGLQQARPWVWASEQIRLLLFAGIAPLLALQTGEAVWLAIAFGGSTALLASLIWFRRLRDELVLIDIPIAAPTKSATA